MRMLQFPDEAVRKLARCHAVRDGAVGEIQCVALLVAGTRYYSGHSRYPIGDAASEEQAIERAQDAAVRDLIHRMHDAGAIDEMEAPQRGDRRAA